MTLIFPIVARVEYLREWRNRAQNQLRLVDGESQAGGQGLRLEAAHLRSSWLSGHGQGYRPYFSRDCWWRRRIGGGGEEAGIGGGGG